MQISVIIGGLGADALPELLPALKDRSDSVRLAATFAFSQIDPKPAGAATILAHLLKDPNGLIRVSSAIALGRMGTNAAPAIPALIQALKDSDLGPTPARTVAITSGVALRGLSPAPGVTPPTTVVPISAPVVAPAKVGVRANAAAALGKLGVGARAAVSALTGLLNDPDPYTREQAAVALWRIAQTGNVGPALAGALECAGTDIDCERILRELGEVGIAGIEARPVVAKLSQAYSWPMPPVRPVPTGRLFAVSNDMRQRARQVLTQIDPDLVTPSEVK